MLVPEQEHEQHDAKGAGHIEQPQQADMSSALQPGQGFCLPVKHVWEEDKAAPRACQHHLRPWYSGSRGAESI